MDVDGYPGGALWRSDNNGRSDSWRDATPQIAASLLQVRMGSWCYCCRCSAELCCSVVPRSGKLTFCSPLQHLPMGRVVLHAAAAVAWCTASAAALLLLPATLHTVLASLATAAGQHHADGGDGHPLARNQAGPHPVPGQGRAHFFELYVASILLLGCNGGCWRCHGCILFQSKVRSSLNMKLDTQWNGTVENN